MSRLRALLAVVLAAMLPAALALAGGPARAAEVRVLSARRSWKSCGFATGGASVSAGLAS